MARLSALVPWLHSTDRDPEVASTGSLLAPLFLFPSHSPCCSISIPIVLLTFSPLLINLPYISSLAPFSSSFQFLPTLSSFFYTISLLSRRTGIRRMAGSTTLTAVEATHSRTISRTKCEVVQDAEAERKRLIFKCRPYIIGNSFLQGQPQQYQQPQQSCALFFSIYLLMSVV